MREERGDTVRGWLVRLGLGQYAAAFEENDVDVDVLPDLTVEDLKDLGIASIGHRRLIMRAVSELGAREPEVAETPEADHVAEPESAGTAEEPYPSAERRQLTVLFSDLVGSTAMSAALDPEEMGALLRDYQRAVTAQVERFDGFVAQHLGDGIVTYFGYPRAHEDDPERAVRTALAIVDAVSRLKDPNGNPLAARVGIATGLVVVGDLMGAGSARHRSVIGETPNLAARLQALGQPNQVIVANDTRRLLGSLFELESMGEMSVKGIAKPISPWLITGAGPDEGRFKAMRELTPMFGRAAEISLLKSRWASSQEGEPQLVLLSGGAGLGKSRLVEEIVSEVRDSGRIHRYYCSPFHSSSAYQPVVTQIERAAGFTRSDSNEERLDKLDLIVSNLGLDPDEVGPLIAPLLSLDPSNRYPPITLAPTALKGRTFAVLTKLLLKAWADRPLLIVLEDAHWIDPTTTELFSHLLASTEEQQVMFLVTFRPEFEKPWREAGIATTAIELSRLSRARCVELVRRLAGGMDLPESVLDHILLKTDGIPLYVEEMTKSILDSDVLEKSGDHYELTAPLASFSIPTTLKDSLMSRLDRISPVKEVAQIGSVIGRRFTEPLLAAIARMKPEMLSAALDKLVEAELFHRSGPEEERVFTFKHALIRDAAYESLLNSRRVELHSRIAEVLEAAFPEIAEADPQLVASHLESAHLEGRAVPYWLKAGQKAMSASAMVEALRHLEKGLALVDRIEDPAERDAAEFGLRMSLGLAHISQQGWQAPMVAEHLEPAFEIGQRLGDSENLLMVIYGLWIHWLNRADFAESQRWIDRAIQDFGGGASLDWDLVIHTMQVIQERWSGNHAGVETEANKVLELYDPDRHRRFVYMFGNDPRVAALGFQSWSSWMTGKPEKAEAEREACARYSAEVNHPFDRCWQLMVGSLVSYFNGDRETFARCVDEAKAIGDEQSVPFVQFILGPVWTGLVHIMSGEWREATEIMPQGINVWRQMGGGVAIPFWEGSLGYAHVQLGEVEEGLSLIESGLATAEKTGEYWFEPELHRLKGEALLHRDPPDRDAARAAFERAVSLADEQGAKELAARAQRDLDRL